MTTPKTTVCFETNINEAWVIRLSQTGKGVNRFSVQYGLQIKDGLNYEQAALELGACLMHEAACSGRLDNRT